MEKKNGFLDDYERIGVSDANANGFAVPSFIDCTKMYSINLDDSVDISELSSRNISPVLAEKIRARIARKKQEGRHVVYHIPLADIKRWNSKICISQI